VCNSNLHYLHMCVCVCVCVSVHYRMYQLKMNEVRQDGKDNLLEQKLKQILKGKLCHQYTLIFSWSIRCVKVELNTNISHACSVDPDDGDRVGLWNVGFQLNFDAADHLEDFSAFICCFKYYTLAKTIERPPEELELLFIIFTHHVSVCTNNHQGLVNTHSMLLKV
jgi:hypothetical protein